VNVQGTLNILEAAREIKVSTNGSKKMASVFAPSSIAVFGPSTPQDGTPDDVVCAPSTMYGISKHHLELLGNYYHQRYGLDFRSLRFPGVLSASDPGGGTTDYVMDMYNEALKYKQCTSFLSEDIEVRESDMTHARTHTASPSMREFPFLGCRVPDTLASPPRETKTNTASLHAHGGLLEVRDRADRRAKQQAYPAGLQHHCLQCHALPSLRVHQEVHS